MAGDTGPRADSKPCAASRTWTPPARSSCMPAGRWAMSTPRTTTSASSRLQEREEWLSRWAADGDMPVMMVEFGTPLYTSFHRGRRGYAKASTSEPLYTEFCAIYQGADAYRFESPAYRATLASTFEKEMLWSNWHGIARCRASTRVQPITGAVPEKHLAHLAHLGSHRRHVPMGQRPRLAARRHCDHPAGQRSLAAFQTRPARRLESGGPAQPDPLLPSRGHAAHGGGQGARRRQSGNARPGSPVRPTSWIRPITSAPAPRLPNRRCSSTTAAARQMVAHLPGGT